MADAAGNRLTVDSADNHQSWLWFIHVFSILIIGAVVSMRFWVKRKRYGASDASLLIAHLLYVSYWMTVLFALTNGLGKAVKLVDEARELRASKLVFASRILLVIVLNVSKIASMFLIQEIFTKDATRWWFRAIIGSCALQTIVGCLLISVNCSPSRVLLSGNASHCPGNSARWVIFTVFEALLETVLVIPVVIIVINLQTNIQNKMFAISVFFCRLIIWVPAFLNLDFNINFNHGGRTNIGVAPSIAMEQLWLTLALVSASTPALMRIAKRFTTTGVALGTTYGSSRSRSASRSKEISHALSSFTKGRDRTQAPVSNVGANDDANHGGELRPDQGLNTISIDAAKRRGEGASIGSTAESHVGILRKVDFDVSSETR